MSPMKNVFLVCCSNRNMERQTERMMVGLQKLGAALIEQGGCAEVAFARNLALTSVVNLMPLNPTRTVVLMIDDDIVFKLEDVYALIKHALASGHATSACYVLSDGRLAAKPWKNGTWLTGLGMLAIPSSLLLKCALASETCIDGESKKPVYELTSSRSELIDGVRTWMPEDFRLTMNLGGVDLLPISVGHIKPKVLAPEQQGLAEFLAKCHEPKEKSVCLDMKETG